MIDEPPPDDLPPSEESAADFYLAPPQPATLDQLQVALPAPTSESNKSPSELPTQFSLGEFMLWIAIVSIGLSGLAWVPPPIFAGICGFAALAMLIATVLWNPVAPLFQLVWYALLAMYMISIVIAILLPTHPSH